MDWYRAYHGMPHDPKLQVIAKRIKQPMAHVVAVWACVLDAASQHKPRGVFEGDAEEIAVVQDLEFEAVEAIICAFHDRNMIDDYNCVTAWDRRQYTTSTERSKKSRAVKNNAATRCNTVQRRATRSNTKQREKQQISTDTEQIQNRGDTEHNRKKTEQSRTEKKIKQKKNTEREEKGECEREKQASCGQNSKSQTANAKIADQMLDIWNAEVQSRLTPEHKAKLTPKRRELMARSWFDDFQQDIEAWRYFCEVVAASDFCMGKLEGKGWTIDLTWAVESSDHVAKVLEGGFSGGKHPSKPTSCDVPELSLAWEFVIDSLEQKFNKGFIRSWLGNTIIIHLASVADGSIVTLQCPRKFIRDWIETHFLADINQAWNDQPYYHIPIIKTELITKENPS